MRAEIKLMAFGVALAAMSCFAVDTSANAPLNDGIDRTASPLAVQFIFARRLRSKILILEQLTRKGQCDAVSIYDVG